MEVEREGTSERGRSKNPRERVFGPTHFLDRGEELNEREGADNVKSLGIMMPKKPIIGICWLDHKGTPLHHKYFMAQRP